MHDFFHPEWKCAMHSTELDVIGSPLFEYTDKSPNFWPFRWELQTQPFNQAGIQFIQYTVYVYELLTTPLPYSSVYVYSFSLVCVCYQVYSNPLTAILNSSFIAHPQTLIIVHVNPVFTTTNDDRLLHHSCSSTLFCNISTLVHVLSPPRHKFGGLSAAHSKPPDLTLWKHPLIMVTWFMYNCKRWSTSTFTPV